MLKDALEFIKWINEKKLQKTKDEKDALRSLCIAFQKTLLYLNRNTKSGKDDKEEELSSLWLDASLKLKSFDPELAQRCRSKSDYWIEPEKWSDEEIINANIEIEQIRKEIDKKF